MKKIKKFFEFNKEKVITALMLSLMVSVIANYFMNRGFVFGI